MRSILVGIAAAVLVAGSATAATPRNMLVIGTDVGAIPTLDPAALNARTVSEVVCNLYDNLVTLAPDDLATVRPMLAEHWEIAPDQRSISFTLRSGAKFESGNPITADDAAWSLQRVIKLGLVGNTDFAPWGYTRDNVERLIRVTSPTTLVLDLPEPVNPQLVLYSIAGSSLGIIDRKSAMAHERNGDLARDWLKANPTSSGPFKLVEWRPNDLLIAERRDGYWGPAPPMRRVVMRNVNESGSLRLQLEAGDVDVAQYLGAPDLDALAREKDITIQNALGFGFYYLALNMKDPDLAKPQVREAFKYLLDWDGLSKTSMHWMGFPWQSIIPRDMPGADPSIHYRLDIPRAKALLAEAGYAGGLHKSILPSGPEFLPMVESLQATAKQAGVDIEIIPGRHVEEFRDRKFQIYFGNSGARLPDPFATATQFAYNPDNRDEARLGGYYLWRTAWNPPDFTDMVNRSRLLTDPAQRAALFADLDRRYREASPSLIMFFQRTDAYAVRNAVQNYVGHPTWTTRWDKVAKN